MERSKVLAVVAALIAAGTAAVVFAGGASAASWHVYQGDMYAGHAYGLQVPADAESVEFAFAGSDAGKATIGVYAPGGKKVGSYALSPALTAASIANPSPGEYVVYVYEVTDGALSVRVASEDEPALELSAVDLVREDVKIGSFPQGRLDQAITTELKAEPVFLTLLYEGSAKMLDASVASATANVVTIEDETATAFSPGVWTTLRGERAFDPAGLVGTTYTVEAHAEQFEGTMVLTSLALDLAKPAAPVVPPVGAPARPPAPDAPAYTPRVAGPAVFALAEATPVAFHAVAGTLILADPAGAECDPAAEDYDRDCSDVHALVSLYAPDDSVLAVVVLDHETPSVEIELPVDGEYVAYARSAANDAVLAQLVGAAQPPELRALATAEDVFEFDVGSFGASEAALFELEHVPLALALGLDDGIGTLTSAYVENDGGVVASSSDLVALGGLRATPWTYEDLELFAAGEHTLSVGGIYEGRVTLTSLHYLRDVEAEAPPVEETEEEEEGEEHGSPMPLPPGAPLARLAELFGFAPF